MMSLHGKTLLRNALGPLAAACTLLPTASCDSFLVPICSFNAAAAGCPEAAPPGQPGSDGGHKPDSSMPPSMTTITESSFKWAAKRELDPNAKYVGMAQGRAITWQNDQKPFYLKSWMLDLNNPNESSRVVGQGCDDCPNVSLSLGPMDFNLDQIYVAGGVYWRLKYHDDNSFSYFDMSNRKFVNGIALSDSQNPKAFVHPQKNSLVVGVQVASGRSFLGAVVMQNYAPVLNVPNKGGPPTAFVLGDLDSVDQNNTLDEIIVFVGAEPLTLVRPANDQMYLFDEALRAALATSISMTKTDDSPIDAAFITDLNYDGKTDFLYIRKGAVFVTTYLGNYTFQNWSAAIPLPEITGETIRSLVAVDIAKNNLPELVVETNKAVHFYVNQ